MDETYTGKDSMGGMDIYKLRRTVRRRVPGWRPPYCFRRHATVRAGYSRHSSRSGIGHAIKSNELSRAPSSDGYWNEGVRRTNWPRPIRHGVSDAWSSADARPDNDQRLDKFQLHPRRSFHQVHLFMWSNTDTARATPALPLRVLCMYRLPCPRARQPACPCTTTFSHSYIRTVNELNLQKYINFCSVDQNCNIRMECGIKMECCV